MNELMCEVEGCYTKAKAKAACSMHYNRMHRYGSYEPKEPYMPPPDRPITTDDVLRSRLWNANVFA